MPTNRTRRRRTPIEPDVITALRTGAEVEYSPANWDLLVGAFYFRDCELTDGETECARKLMAEWLDQQHAHEREKA
jgi:hypothetical protein